MPCRPRLLWWSSLSEAFALAALLHPPQCPAHCIPTALLALWQVGCGAGGHSRRQHDRIPLRHRAPAAHDAGVLTFSTARQRLARLLCAGFCRQMDLRGQWQMGRSGHAADVGLPAPCSRAPRSSTTRAPLMRGGRSCGTRVVRCVTRRHHATKLDEHIQRRFLPERDEG